MAEPRPSGRVGERPPSTAPMAASPALVSTDWLADHLDDPGVRIVESNEDVLLYATGHIPGAVHADWQTDLQDPITRDVVSVAQFEGLCARLGIRPDTTVVFYGDKSNWWACYALWTFRLLGHADCRILDGGRMKWVAEGRDLTRDVPAFESTAYAASAPDPSIRAFRDDVFAHIEADGPLVDVRSPQEYAGELMAIPGYPQEGALRAGHIAGARNVPWARAANEDGTFKSRDELEAIYLGEQGLDPATPTVAYCRIGERSSHTWFVLTELLGFADVRNYDGSWTEWGNLVGAPIERGDSDV